MPMRAIGSLGLLLLGAAACNDIESKPETADKLKPVLVQVNAPTGADPAYHPPLWGETVRIDFHFIAPSGQAAISATPTVAEAVPLTVPAPLPTLLGSPEVDAAWPGIQHITVHATIALPSEAAMAAIYPEVSSLDLLRFRYALNVGDGERTVPLTGDFPAYRTAAVPGADWNLYGSGITEPVADGASVGGEIDIKSAIVNVHDEAIKVGWYVSDGEIKNRRASETKWKLPGSGAHTLVFTVRGKQSRTGTIAFRSVTVP